MWQPGVTPFSPFVSTGFLLSSCPWDKISFLIFYQSFSVYSNSLAFATISLLSSDLTYEYVILAPHFKSCSRFLTWNHPLQPLLPSGLQDPILSNTYSFKNAKTANGFKKSHPPPIAGPSFHAAPTSAVSFQHHPPHLQHFIFSPLLLFHCHVCSWYENCP